MRKFLISILATFTFFVCGCGGVNSGNKESAEIEETSEPVAEAKDIKADLKITMLNVGQGDAFLIQTKSQNILIDTSDSDERDLLVSELEKAGVKTIDKMILTHPHADHIGGAKLLIAPTNKELQKYPYLKDFLVREVYDNGIASTSPLYKGYMSVVKSKKLKYEALTSDHDPLDFGNGAKFEILFPSAEVVKFTKSGETKGDPNNESVVGRLVYKKFSMMFTGDAEKPVEMYLVNNYDKKKLQSTILKSGHHGSYTASTKDFLKNVAPQYVMISCGPEEPRRNTYHHPHLEPLQNYLDFGIKEENIFCTNFDGTTVIKTDGKNISIESERKGEWLDEWIKKKQKDRKK